MNKKKILSYVLITVIALALLIYNAFYINPHQLKVRTETLVSDKVDSKLDGSLILYFSDLKYGSNINEDRLESLKEQINEFKADVIFFGGDVIDTLNITKLSEEESEILVTFFKDLKASSMKCAVLGEADLYTAEMEESIRNILKRADFRIYENTNDRIMINDSFINIIGIDSMLGSTPDIEKSFEGLNANYFSLAVSHTGDSANGIDKTKCDYFIAGHSLGGKVYIPLINLLFRDEGSNNYYHGKYKDVDLTVDITNGVGTPSENVRLFADSEIVVYKLKKS
ncbi:MAG: hypothetical protein Q4B60_04220 [Erysipelotrichaceae bacterium]|nr:hypothetical protein [Erysipelotrichaceae bacterium]